MSRTVRRSSELEAPPEQVWEALRQPSTLVHVAGPLLRFPDLESRTAPWRPGETVETRVRLLGVLPLSRHVIAFEQVDEQRRVVQTHEHGGPVRSWRHRITVEPSPGGRACYTDAVEVDAGVLTPVVAAGAAGLYRWRHRRWRALARTLSGAGRGRGRSR